MSRPLRRVLLVEDDPDIAVLARIALGDLGGLEVEHSPDGASAIARAGAFAPDLLLLDYTLPDMTGGEVLQAIRDLPGAAGVPAMFITASVMPPHVDRLRQLGALEVFAKPFDPLTLAERIRAVWAEAFGPAS